MGKLEELLKDQPFSVNAFACERAAEVLARYRMTTTNRQAAEYSPDQRFASKLCFIAICHQMNWDYLQARIAAVVLPMNPESAGHWLSVVRAADVQNWLHDCPTPERIRASERASLLRNLGEQLTDRFGGNPSNVLASAGGKILGANGLMELLDCFDAYRLDPLRKKSNVLVQELIREQIARFSDENSVAPAIDYHIIRLYLRTGRVAPKSDVLAEFLIGSRVPRPRLVTQLRRAVSEALCLTARFAGLPVSVVNYLEWQIGRSICERGTPGCQRVPAPLPADPDVARLYSGSCPFTSFCVAYRDATWRSLEEPRFKSVFY